MSGAQARSSRPELKSLWGRARRVDPDPTGCGSGVRPVVGPGPGPKILDPAGSILGLRRDLWQPLFDLKKK